MNRRRALAGGALLVAAASVAAWALAYPQSSLTMTLVRAVADCAAVISLGLAVVPMLDAERYRSELIGRAGLLGVGAAAAVYVTTAVAPRTVPVNLVVAGLAAVGVTARVVTGHFFESALGGLGVAVHTLAAALWCGTLAGLVLTVEHRGQWARVLPRFSQLSLWCVLMLLVGGTVGVVDRVGSPAELYATGYGRLWRRCWCCWAVEPAARTHRATAAGPDRVRSPNWR